MYSYGYSRASLEPRIEGLSTLMKTSTYPKLKTKQIRPCQVPGQLILVTLCKYLEVLATRDTSNHRHYQGGHSRRQHVVWAGSLSPRFSSEIPEGTPSTQNAQRICKRRQDTFNYSSTLSHISLHCQWNGLGNMSVEGFFTR